MKSLSIIGLLGIAVLFANPANAEPQEYIFDKDHSHIGMTWNHLGFSDFRARFADFAGSLVLDEDAPENSTLMITIPIASIDTGVEVFDGHLQGENFFNATEHPNATFKSTRVEQSGENTAKVHGDLTIRGVTKPVVLDVVLNKIGDHPMSGKKAAGFTATTQVDRSAFGIDYAVPAVSDRIDIFISTEVSVAD